MEKGLWQMETNNNGMSKTRGIYFARLVGRIAVFIIVIWMYFSNKDAFGVAEGWAFLHEFSPLHLLWMLWMWDMVLQLIPVKSHISIGSQKVFESLFRPIQEKVNYKNLKKYIKDTTAAAYKVMLIWIAVTVIISALHLLGFIDTGIMILIATFFMFAI